MLDRESEVENARSRLGAARRERDLLVELGRLRGVRREALEEIAGAEGRGSGNGTAPSAREPRRPGPQNAEFDTRRELRSCLLAILHERGEPVQIGELMSAVLERGATIPGRGDQANLISFVRRHDEFVRPARGYYGLREWGLEDARPKTSTKRRRRARSGS